VGRTLLSAALDLDFEFCLKRRPAFSLTKAVAVVKWLRWSSSARAE